MLLHATVSFNKVIHCCITTLFCNTFGANVYSHPMPVKIIQLLLKLKNVGCVQLCAVFSCCVHLCVVFSIFIDQWTTRDRGQNISN